MPKPTLTDNPAESQRIAFLQGVIEKALQPHGHNTEAALAAGAALRVAKKLLSFYPPAVRAELMLGARTFLAQEDAIDDRAAELKRLGFVLPRGLQ